MSTSKKILIGFGVVLIIGVLGNLLPKQKTSPPAPSPAAQLMDAEKKYISAAGGYLKTVNQYGLELGETMGGLSTGASTLGMVKKSLERTQRYENVSFHGDYSPTPIPEEFRLLDQKIKECHRLYDAAFEEMLEYWKDSNVAHIQSGSTTLNRAVSLTNECITNLNRQMEIILARKASN